ncbi:MAG: hypothetical protein IJV82_04040 [Oscillospiraceae bacterium]|nr:hypothetical protein [Oscillospiraceae bacterium]
MKKDNLRGGIGLAVVLVLYHLVVFLIPFEREEAFWIAYGFTLVAFLVMAVALYMAFGKNGDARSKFYGFPIGRLGVLYGGLQIVAGLAVMALGYWVPWQAVLLVFAIGLGAAVIGMISVESVVEQIQVQDKKLEKDVALMRALQSKVNQMSAQCDSPDLKRFAEEIRYSDPVSSPALEAAEHELMAVVDQLQAAVVDGESQVIGVLCRRASAALAERNRLCKLNK